MGVAVLFELALTLLALGDWLRCFVQRVSSGNESRSSFTRR